jgi:hypothetical protein
MSQDLAATDSNTFYTLTNSIQTQCLAFMGTEPSYLTQASLIKWRCHKCSSCNIPIHHP